MPTVTEMLVILGDAFAGIAITVTSALRRQDWVRVFAEILIKRGLITTPAGTLRAMIASTARSMVVLPAPLPSSARSWRQEADLDRLAWAKAGFGNENVAPPSASAPPNKNVTT
jgi:hypothetical protein